MSVVFNPGDKVRLTRGDEALNGQVVESPYADLFLDQRWIVATGVTWMAKDWERNGWQVSVVPSTPTPELPTEPGAYADNQGRPWILARNRQWVDWSGTYIGGPQERVFECAPFTRLGSRESWRASWANEILNRVSEAAQERAGNPWNASVTINAVRREFGGAVVDE